MTTYGPSCFIVVRIDMDQAIRTNGFPLTFHRLTEAEKFIKLLDDPDRYIPVEVAFAGLSPWEVLEDPDPDCPQFDGISPKDRQAKQALITRRGRFIPGAF